MPRDTAKKYLQRQDIEKSFRMWGVKKIRDVRYPYLLIVSVMVLPSNSHPALPPETWNHGSDYGSVKLFTAAPLQNVTPAHSMQSPPSTTYVSQLSLCALVSLSYLMFSANAVSSLCTFTGVTLSA